jgi:hypothetical protein
LPLELTWGYRTPGGRTIAIRASDASGRTWMATREIEAR